MKTIGGICLCLLLLTIRVQSQNIEPVHAPYGLDSVSWNKANEIWRGKSSMVTVLTNDNVAHIGQIVAITDSTMLLYEDEGLFDPTISDSVLRFYLVENISAIFSVDSVEEVSRTPICAVIGGAVGVVLGAGLHVFLPGNTFHPVFIVPAAGAGVIVGAGISAGKRDSVVVDTTWICTHDHFKDSAAPGESELIWSTYDYTIWQDTIPESAHWTSSGIEVDPPFTFDDLTASSLKIGRAFPDAKIYMSLSGKVMITKHHNLAAAGSLYMFNVGYNVNSNWAVDAYYCENSSEVEVKSADPHYVTMDGRHTSLSLSYILAKHDRFNTQRFQCTAGMGIAFGSFDFHDALPGYDRWYANVFGVMGKLNLATFLTQRFAIVLDMQQTFLKPIVLPSYDWHQPQGSITIPEETIDASYFQVGLGMRLHF